MMYYKTDEEKPILRDYLAAERTHLANERTLLAYLRTALIILVTAFTFFKLFAGDTAMRIAAFSLIPAAILIGAFGIYRFRQVKNKLAEFDKNR